MVLFQSKKCGYSDILPLSIRSWENDGYQSFWNNDSKKKQFFAIGEGDNEFKTEVSFTKAKIAVLVGDIHFTIPYELKHLIPTIEDSKHLLNKEDDWDDEESSSTSIELLTKAIKFIVDYSSYIFENIENTVISAPYVDILRDGAIIVVWENSTSSFTIIFDKKDSDFSYYYAKVNNDEIPPLKYMINNNKGIDKIITAPWMATNLKYKAEMYSL